VIRCNNCGTMNPDTRTNCQNCMAPLPVSASRGENSPTTRTNMQDQPALPAWLESLRAGDHPAVSPKNFSAEDMAEEGKVPDWMQLDRSSRDQNNSNPYPAMRSASSPAPNTDETFIPKRNISANSLIDANSLPSWMQPEKPQAPQQSIAASSLIQPEYMPDWMRSMQPSQGQPSSPMPQQRPAAMQPPTQGFSAQQLIDPQSLPTWMQQEGGQNVTSPTQQAPAQPYNSSSNQGGFSASSLLDMNAMPSWMREGQGQNSPTVQQGQQPSWQTPPQSPTPQRGYEQSRQAPQQGPWQTPPQQQQQPAYPPVSPPATNMMPTQQGPGGTLSMGSLIDVNALPEWLRSAAEAQQGQTQQQGQTGNQQQYTGPNNYGTPQRIDNVRVPSRPRGEIGTNEGSEVAANVFASMLGVASNAPQYPNQQPGNPTFASGQQGSMLPSTQQAPGMPDAQHYSTSPAGPQNYGQQTGYPNGMPMGQPMYSGNPGSILPPSNQGMAQQRSAQDNNEKTQKKGGIFEAIRNFFFRQ